MENKIGIIDYGMGNLKSVFNSFKQFGIEPVFCKSPKDIFKCNKIVLPGVGSFAKAMFNLKQMKLDIAIKKSIGQGMPFLGICLGMQLLFTSSEEEGLSSGLDCFKGKVVKFNTNQGLKVPHIGWNNVDIIKNHPIFNGIKKGVDFYYVHSFHCVPENKEIILATCENKHVFVSSIANNNVVCTQFHPEKSQVAGLKIIENFIEWDGKC